MRTSVLAGSLAVSLFVSQPALAARECSESMYFGRATAKQEPKLKAMTSEPTDQPAPPTHDDQLSDQSNDQSNDQFTDDPLPGEEAYRKEYRPSILREKQRMAAIAAGQDVKSETPPGESPNDRKQSRERAGEAFGMRERQ